MKNELSVKQFLNELNYYQKVLPTNVELLSDALSNIYFYQVNDIDELQHEINSPRSKWTSVDSVSSYIAVLTAMSLLEPDYIWKVSLPGFSTQTDSRGLVYTVLVQLFESIDEVSEAKTNLPVTIGRASLPTVTYSTMRPADRQEAWSIMAGQGYTYDNNAEFV